MSRAVCLLPLYTAWLGHGRLFLSCNIRFEPFVIEIWQRTNCFTCQRVHLRQRDRWCDWSSCPLYPRPKAVLDSHCTRGWIGVGGKGLLFCGPLDRPISLLRTQIFSYVSEDGASPSWRRNTSQKVRVFIASVVINWSLTSHLWKI